MATTWTKATRRRRYIDLRVRDPKLYKGWTNYVRLCWDHLDWGYLHVNKKAKPRANSRKDQGKGYHKRLISEWRQWETCQRQWDRPKSPKQLTLWRIEDHGRGISILYYTSNPTGVWATLLLDIDDKTGEAGDAHDVFRFLLALFPNIYGQTSTFGKGYHGYLTIHYPHISVADFRVLCSTLEQALVRALADHQFRSTIEVKGVPPLLNAYGSYVTCGQLAKIPCLSTDADIADYLKRPVYAPAALQAVVDMFPAPEAQDPVSVPTTINGAEKEEMEGEEADPLPNEAAAGASVPPTIDEREEGEERHGEDDREPELAGVPTQPPRKPASVPTTLNETEEGEEEEIGPKRWDLWSRCPAKRMGNVSRALVRTLGRVHTPAELLDQYQRLGMHTGEDDDGNRAYLAHRQTEWQLVRFRDGLVGSGLPRYEDRREGILGLVERHVTPVVREWVKQKNRAAYTAEQLAVTMYAIEVAATVPNPKHPKHQFTVGNQYILTWAEKLGVEVDGTEDAQRRKLAAIKRVLVEAGLAIWVDEGYNRGRCKRMALGPAHPRYAKNLPLPDVVDTNKGGLHGQEGLERRTAAKECR